MNIVYIHLEGGLIRDVQGLIDDQSYMVLDWDHETEIRLSELPDYIQYILQEDLFTDKEKLDEISNILERVVWKE